MKKIVAFLLIAMLVLSVSLTGCSSNLSYKFEIDLDDYNLNLDKAAFAESLKNVTNIDKNVFITEFDQQEGIITLDFTEIAKTLHGNSASSNKAIHSRFEEYAKGIVKHLTNDIKTVYPDEEFGFQMNEPKEDEEIAIMHTNKGDIYIRFFPEAAPKAVENFKTHSRNGYYNGLTFHRVIKDFMIQGGDPKGNGTGGESIWGEPFEDEFDQKLLNIYGSLAMANSGVKTNGSQFFINQSKKAPSSNGYSVLELYMYNAYSYEYYIKSYSDEGKIQELYAIFPTFESFLASGYAQSLSPLTYLMPEDAIDLYEEVGGNLHLDGAWRASGGHTVFGHVFKGMDVVDSIADVETDSNTNKPTADVIINSIEIVNYTK